MLEATPDPDHDFRKAVRARYFRALAGPKQIGILAAGLIANLLFRNVLFDWLSTQLRWYENMTMVVLGLSVDFYLLCLGTLAYQTFQTYSAAGIFRDLRQAGVRGWSVFAPFLQVLFLLILVDPVIEGLVAAVTGYEPSRLAFVGYLTSLLYAPIAAALIATVILLMNLKRWPLLLQYFLLLGLTFGSAMALTTGGEVLEPYYRQWNPDHSGSAMLKALASLAGGSWNNFANLYAYYTMLLVEGVVLAVLLVPLYTYTRGVAQRQFEKL